MASKKKPGEPVRQDRRPKRITKRQEAFAVEYIRNGQNASAALRATYDCSRANANTVARRASEMLKVPLVAARIDEIKRPIIEKLEREAGISMERTLKELARIAYFDARKLFNADGTPKPINDLDDDTVAALAGLEVASVGNAEVGIGQVMKYKIADKNSALDKCMKHLGLYERDNRQKPDPASEAQAAQEAVREGFEDLVAAFDRAMKK